MRRYLPHPYMERTFTAVRAALPAANVAAFDTELEAITHEPVVDLAALDEFLSGWYPGGRRSARLVAHAPRGRATPVRCALGGPDPGRGAGSARGPAVGAYTIGMGSDVAEAQIDDLSDAEIDVLLEIYEALRLTPTTAASSPRPATCTSGTTRASR